MDILCDYILRKHYVDIPTCFSPTNINPRRLTEPDIDRDEAFSYDYSYYDDDPLYWEPILKWFKSVFPAEYLQQRTLQRLLGE